MQGLSLFQLSAGPLGTLSIFWFYYTLELFLMYQFGDNKYMVTWCKIHLLDGNLFRTTSKARQDLLLIKAALLWRLALLCHHTWWSLYHVIDCCKHL